MFNINVHPSNYHVNFKGPRLHQYFELEEAEHMQFDVMHTRKAYLALNGPLGVVLESRFFNMMK